MTEKKPISELSRGALVDGAYNDWLDTFWVWPLSISVSASTLFFPTHPTGSFFSLFIPKGQKDVLDTRKQSFVDDPPVILFSLVDRLCQAISLWLPSLQVNVSLDLCEVLWILLPSEYSTGAPEEFIGIQYGLANAMYCPLCLFIWRRPEATWLRNKKYAHYLLLNTCNYFIMKGKDLDLNVGRWFDYVRQLWMNGMKWMGWRTISSN